MLFILSFIITAWGIAIIGLGRRGRRLDDHPICRGCGFDLVGSLPPGRRLGFAVPREARCPECGKALARRGAIEIGNRARRPPLIAAGFSLAALGMVGLLLTAWASSSALGLARPQPTWMLVWRAGADQQAVQELAARIARGTITKSAVQSLVERALKIQGETSPGEWHSTRAWGDLIESARRAGLVDDRQWGVYARQGAEPVELRLAMGLPDQLQVGSAFRYGSPGLQPRAASIYVLARLSDVEFENATGAMRMTPGAGWARYPVLAEQPGWRLLAGNDIAGFAVLDLASGPVAARAGPARVRAVVEFKVINPDGTSAAEWRETYEVPIGR